MKVLWVRGGDDVSFNKPNTWFALGRRGSGKSSFLEHVAECYLNAGHSVFDLFGSRDGENLAWLRSRHADEGRKILLLKGENVDVEGSFPVKQASQLTLADVENFDIIINSSPLYLSIDQEFFNAAKLTDMLYKRMYYRKLVYMIVREAANFYYSRLKVSESQVFAKSQMIYLIREARHCGIALGLDSIRYYAIDIDVRHLSDYLILKSQGASGLASDLRWLYSLFDPAIVASMPRQNFIVLSQVGAVGVGTFPFPEWHKREKENILAAVGLKIEYGEIPKEAMFKGKYKTVGDAEHAEIIRLYIEDRLSVEQIAEKLNRSSRTPFLHIRNHDIRVEKAGECIMCKRVHSKYYNTLVQKAKLEEEILHSGRLRKI